VILALLDSGAWAVEGESRRGLAVIPVTPWSTYFWHCLLCNIHTDSEWPLIGATFDAWLIHRVTDCPAGIVPNVDDDLADERTAYLFDGGYLDDHDDLVDDLDLDR
jgi:hypothetical protein